MWSYFFSNLFSKKFRSLLLLISVLVCVFLISTVDGMLSQMKQGFEKELTRYMGKISIQQKGSVYPPFNSSISVSIYEEISKFSEVNNDETSPLLMSIIEQSDNPMDFAKVYSVGMIPGKEKAYLIDTEIESGDITLIDKPVNNIILGHGAANFYNFPKIGDDILIEGKKAFVCGILKETGQDNIDNIIIMNLEFVKEIYKTGNDINSILITPKNPENINELVDILKNKFPDYEIITQKDVQERIGQIMSMPNKFMGMISWVVFMVSIVIITNIMIISVNERKKEIGILRAIGFQRHQIIFGILFESFILSIIGGVIGILLSIPVAIAMDWAWIISLEEIIKILILILVIGSFSGLYPAIKASVIQPMEGIQYE